MWHENLILLITIAATARGMTPNTMSLHATGSGDTHKRLVGGHDITSRRAARIVQWLSDHWPPGAEWPADIPRPVPAPDSPAASLPAAPPAPPGEDPPASVRRLRARRSELYDVSPLPVDRIERVEAQMYTVALALRPDGQVASPAAVCLALGTPRYVFDDVLRRYRDGAGGRKPRTGSACARMLVALVGAGDVRFASRRPGAAA